MKLKTVLVNRFLVTGIRRKALEPLMPSERYLFIPFLRSRSQMRKTCRRVGGWTCRIPILLFESLKDHRTNIIATNFVCEQLVSYPVNFDLYTNHHFLLHQNYLTIKKGRPGPTDSNIVVCFSRGAVCVWGLRVGGNKVH